MKQNDYILRWLGPADSRAIAAVEAQVHRPDHRSGEEIIRAQLEETEYGGRNLSIGLYFRDRLVGFGLAFVMRNRHEMAEFFDVAVPEGIDAHRATIYIADFVVVPEHRKASRLVANRFAAVIRRRPEFNAIAMDMFSTAEYAQIWSARRNLPGRLGWDFESRTEFRDPKLKQPLHWLTFSRRATRVAPSEESWRHLIDGDACGNQQGLATYLLRRAGTWAPLENVWRELALRSPPRSVYQTFEYVSTWYEHPGVCDDSVAILACRHGAPAALAIFNVNHTSWLGRQRSYLRFPAIGGMQHPAIIGSDVPAIGAIAQRVTSASSPWSGLELTLDQTAADFDSQLSTHARLQGWLIARDPCGHQVNIDVGATVLPPVVGNNDAASARFEIHTGFAAAAAFEDYIALEIVALPGEHGLGLTCSAASVTFHRALIAEHAATLGVAIAMLRIGEQPVAGAFGFIHEGMLHLVHVTRTAAPDAADVARSLLLQLCNHCGHHRLCMTIEIPQLPYLDFNNLGLPGIRGSQLRIEQRSASGLVGHLTGRYRSWRRRFSTARLGAVGKLPCESRKTPA